jgi:chromosome partitioning protein
MHTLVFTTQKGGSGKSTLAAGIALAAQQAGNLVRLIETDPQGTLSSWQSRRAAHNVVVESVYDAVDIEPHLQHLRSQGTDLAILDTSGGMSAATRTAIFCADLCLVPTRPSIADLESAASTLRIIRAARRPFAFILNQAPSRGERGNLAASSLSSPAQDEFTDVMALPFIASRNDHQDALAAGLTATEYAPEGKAALEIRGLWSWIERRLYRRTIGHVGSKHASVAGLLAERRGPGGDDDPDLNVPWDSCL